VTAALNDYQRSRGQHPAESARGEALTRLSADDGRRSI